ncbi:histidinol-phosphatase HisJ [Halalkalibacter urbisdiaboli]|uniref:histidinol-phosphatase HisJ n=1 Tax=Halalkalibacter urbisdiaboli TaxID=1960589 RepID=UPI001A991C56|nr:histidinol-phosphatase HisJ [Halalkalibacter urbisdiaboli]
MILHDGHVHTPYCPHGTNDPLSDYCEKAIELGLKGITFTEHAPLPTSFMDPTPQQDSAMKLEHLLDYFKELKHIKETYRGKLDVLIGLEVDYIEEYEEQTKQFLNEFGHYLDDSILSVHFLKLRNDYICIDYSPEAFQDAISKLGSIEAVYKRYLETLKKSVSVDLGRYKPKRIGHLTLVKKFKKKFPTSGFTYQDISELLLQIKENGYTLDYNGAGTLKPLCGEPYPDTAIVQKAFQMGIPLVYGSDAHQVSGLMAGVKQLSKQVKLIKP